MKILPIQIRNLRNGDKKIEKTLEKAAKYYESQLWDEDIGCYIYDNTNSPNSVAILADALEGHFNLLVCGVEPVLPEDKVRKMLQRIYYYNFLVYNSKLAQRKQGLGVVNGIRINKSKKVVDDSFENFPKFEASLVEGSFQARESWIGVCYTLAALLMLYDEKQKAIEIIKSVYQGVWNGGFHFQTPEAVFPDASFRATSYMRPLSVSSIVYVLQNKELL